MEGAVEAAEALAEVAEVASGDVGGKRGMGEAAAAARACVL